MPRIAGSAVTTPHGDLAATLAALDAAVGRAGELGGDLHATLLGVARQALDGRRPDLVLLATTKGDLPRWCDDLLSAAGTGDGGPAALAARLGESLGAPAFAVSGACASGTLALGVAARWILAGEAARVLVLAGDRLAPFVHDGFAALRAIDPRGCRPFDAGRAGLALGETAAAVLLEAEPDADAGRALYLQGWGARLDANHLTGPDRQGSGLAQACRAALARAGGDPPALVIGHGTGTRYNDDAESLAYAAVCGDSPVVGFKGLLGHSLGACGLTEFALGAMIRLRGRTPGTVGLTTLGCAGAIRALPPGLHALSAGPLLTANAGFGGINAATVIGATPTARRPTPAIRRRDRVELDARGWRHRCDGGIERAGAWAEPAADGQLPRLGARDVLGRVDPTWGRMDAACRALVALGTLLAPLPENCAVVLLSTAGCAATDRLFERARRDGGGADPQRFAYTLPTTPIGEASIRLRLRGTGLALLGATDAQGLAVARALLADGEPAVLLARVEADRPPTLAWAECWLAG